jgi:hypothetical protein
MDVMLSSSAHSSASSSVIIAMSLAAYKVDGFTLSDCQATHRHTHHEQSPIGPFSAKLAKRLRPSASTAL